MMRNTPLLLRDMLHQLLLGFFYVLCVHQPQSVCHAKYMRIHGNGILAEGIGDYHVCRFSTNTGQKMCIRDSLLLALL